MIYLLSAIAIIFASSTVILLILYIKANARATESASLRILLDEEMERSASLRKEVERTKIQTEQTLQAQEFLSPLKERIEVFNKTFTDARIHDAAVYRSLSEQLDRLINLNSSIGSEARALTDALKGNSKIQGDWGEMILQRLLEKAGLIEGANFITQVTRTETGQTLRNEEGALIRPDVILLLPEGRKLIVDSKVSLKDYMLLCESDTEDQKTRHRQRHLASVKRHIDELASKNYSKSVTGAAEQVIMFMPVEGAFLEAFNDSLWTYAYERHIVMASPSHLSSILLLVSQIWRRERQNSNAEEIARQAGLLYDRFVLFAEDFRKMDTALTSMRKAYDDCAKRLSSGHLSLTARAEKLRELGAKTQKRIPQEMVRDSELD